MPDLADAVRGRVAVIDGTLTPCWSWTIHNHELYSGKHRAAGHNHQILCDLTGRLLHISDPQPGRTHDTKAIRNSGILDILGPSQALADKGYVGACSILPIKKLPGGEMLDWQKEFNTPINRLRYVIERSIANFKPGKSCTPTTDDPNPPIATAFNAVRTPTLLQEHF